MSILDGMRNAMTSEEEMAMKVLFPYQDKFRLLQQLTEVQTRSINSWSVLGVFRRKYKSNILKVFQEESSLNKIALDRKGRLEASEVYVSRRPVGREEED